MHLKVVQYKSRRCWKLSSLALIWLDRRRESFDRIFYGSITCDRIYQLSNEPDRTSCNDSYPVGFNIWAHTSLEPPYRYLAFVRCWLECLCYCITGRQRRGLHAYIKFSSSHSWWQWQEGVELPLNDCEISYDFNQTYNKAPRACKWPLHCSR